MSKAISILSIILLICVSCIERQVGYPKIEWQSFLKVDKAIDFCQIDSVSKNDFIVTYSRSPASGGGFRIIRLNSSENSQKVTTLYQSNENTTYSIKIIDTKIGFVEFNFRKNSLNSTLFISNDLGHNWNVINTPLRNIRNLEFLDLALFIEGTNEGSVQLFKSLDNGNTWDKIQLLKKGVKGISLLEGDKLSNKLLLKGKTGFSISKENKTLLLFDFEKETLIELLDFGDKGGLNYIKPVSKNKNLHGIIDGDDLNIYSLKDESMSFYEKFSIPSNTVDVKNIFLGEEYYLISAREKELNGKILSWISLDKGENWHPYNHEYRYKLVYNTFGQLFMTDINNNILLPK